MGVQLDGIIPRRRWKMNIAASLCLDMECPQWYNKDDIVHLSARALREKAAVPVWRRGKHMTQGDERMKAAKASIRQRLTHSKLPMLVLVGVVLFALIFLGMRFFTRYTREELYRESQNQLTEITSQMYEKLSITLEQQWDFLTVMDRSVAFYAPTTQEALVQLLQATQNQLMSQDSALRFLAIDESGNLINAAGERMPCEFADTLGMTGRQCFLIRGKGGDENQMVFSLPIMQPLTVAMGEKSIRITHLVLLKGMSSLTPFFRSSAFHTQNSTYVVISNGVKMYSDAADENINFLGRNIYPALRTLRYPHAGNFDNCLTELEASDNHFTCTDVLVDKTQYFLCMKRLTGCDWTMLFLVPGVEVAAGARAMVDSITLIVNIAFFVLLLLTVGAMYFLLTAMQNRERYAVETENAQALAQANAELDRARQAAVDALKLAESANVSKTAFLTNMSHDIRTPMNAIIGLTNLMQHDLNNPEKLQAYIDKLHTSSEHLLGLINDVLDMSKIESGAVTLRMDEVNLAEQIEQIEAIIRPQTRQRGQHFIVRASQIHHENFIGDATRLRQVLLNILSNAVKYTQQGGEISLDVREVSRSGHSYVKYAFVVKDNGIGMTEEFQKHLFDVFTRAENSVTNKVQGTGLGMAISKSIVDMMGGVINVESAPGEGSRFEVLLEFKVDAQADDRAHGEGLPPAAGWLYAGARGGRAGCFGADPRDREGGGTPGGRGEHPAAGGCGRSAFVLPVPRAGDAAPAGSPDARGSREADFRILYAGGAARGSAGYHQRLWAGRLCAAAVLPLQSGERDGETAYGIRQYRERGRHIGAERDAAALRGGQSAECGNSGRTAAHAGRDLHDLQRRQAAGGGVRPRPPQRLRRYPDGRADARDERLRSDARPPRQRQPRRQDDSDYRHDRERLCGRHSAELGSGHGHAPLQAD